MSPSCDTAVAILSSEHCRSSHLCAITAPGLLGSDICQHNKCFLLPHSGKKEIYSQKLNWLFIDQINYILSIWLFPCNLKWGNQNKSLSLGFYFSQICLPPSKTQNSSCSPKESIRELFPASIVVFALEMHPIRYCIPVFLNGGTTQVNLANLTSLFFSHSTLPFTYVWQQELLKVLNGLSCVKR